MQAKKNSFFSTKIIQTKKAQATIELMTLILISLFALLFIYSIYDTQITSISLTQEIDQGKLAVEKIVSTANKLSSMGPGSESTISISLPSSYKYSGSSFEERSAILKIRNNLIIRTADVNLSGSWKNAKGFLMKLVFDGNKVNIGYPGIVVNKSNYENTIYPGSSVSFSFIVRNDTYNPGTVTLTEEIQSPVTMDINETSLTLAASQQKSVTTTITAPSTSYGNYYGKITLVASLLDENGNAFSETKEIIVSIETATPFGNLIIYPANNTLSYARNSTNTKAYNACNQTDSLITIDSWTAQASDADALTWFSVPVIGSIAANSCTSFNTTYTIPVGATQKLYDVNIVATYDTDKTAITNNQITIN
jgi:hypothetical protein